MKKLFTLFALIVASFSSNAQFVDFEYAEGSIINSSQAKFQATAILVDQDDNLFAFGYHASANTSTFRNKDMILAKYNAQGQKLWYKHYPRGVFGGSGFYKMHWDADYNLVIAGEMNVILGNDTLVQFNSDISATLGIIKLDSTGNYIWSTQVDALTSTADNFDFVKLNDGNFAVRAEGSCTFKEDSTISLGDADWIARIDGTLGEMITVEEAPYNSYVGINGDLNSGKRKLFANGSNLMSIMPKNLIVLGLPWSTPTIIIQQIDFTTGDTISEKQIPYSFGIFDYHFDSVENVIYFLGSASGGTISIGVNNNINVEPNSRLVIAYDVDNDVILGIDEFSTDYEISTFSYEHGLTMSRRYYGSTTCYTTNKTYYKNNYLDPAAANTQQTLILNYNLDLSHNYWAIAASSNNSLELNDLTYDNNGLVYGCSDGGAKAYFGTLFHGSLGNTNENGKIFKIGDQVLQEVISVTELGKLAVSVYPNPMNDVLNINIEESIVPSSVKIYSVGGKLVQQLSFSNSINVSQLTEGFYILKLTDDQDRVLAVKRVVKQ